MLIAVVVLTGFAKLLINEKYELFIYEILSSKITEDAVF